jgi:hypothetical protein
MNGKDFETFTSPHKNVLSAHNNESQGLVKLVDRTHEKVKSAKMQR